MAKIYSSRRLLLAFNTPTCFHQVAGWVVLITVAFTSVPTAWGQPNSQYPYEALVSRENAVVRSGPGLVHYGTQLLNPGDTVEVYRQDPGGWLAIRPPRNSFALVPESTVEMIREGVGKIVVPDTRAWTGTNLDPVERPLWQVKLRADEEVVVLGEVSWPDPNGHSTIWYQIEPPAGEFRWIHQNDLRPLRDQLPAISQPNQLATEEQFSPARPEAAEQFSPVDQMPSPDSATAPNTIVRDLARDIAMESASPIGSGLKQAPSDSNATIQDPAVQSVGHKVAVANPVIAEPQDNSGINQGWRRSKRALVEAGLPPSTYTQNSRGFDSNRRLELPSTTSDHLAANHSGSLASGAPLRVADAEPGNQAMATQLDLARNLTPPNFVDRHPGSLAEVEALLTAEMVKSDPGQWQLSDLAAAASSLRDPNHQANSVWADRLLAKISRCQQIRAGFLESRSGPANETISTGVATVGSADSMPNNVSSESTFDAAGWLNVLTRSQGTEPPQLVLQDATGKITHLIAPVPGLNLTRYLKQRIGVKGRRGYHHELQLNHVLVERAYPIPAQ